MEDRDGIVELFEIVKNMAEKLKLNLVLSALPYIKKQQGKGWDIFFRRRLSVSRMIMDLHLPVSTHEMDVFCAVSLSHALPTDIRPDDHKETMRKLFKSEPRVEELLALLNSCNYMGDDSFYRLTRCRDALIIRLTERGALVEALYELPAAQARSFISETREYFIPMCIYAKENYPELLAPVSILMEKTRNLIHANEALLNRYDGIENSIFLEILSYREENAAIRAMTEEILKDQGELQIQ